MNRFIISITLILISWSCIAQKQEYVISPPAGKMFTHIDKNGETVIPNGRILTPSGRCFTVAPHPYGLVISKDGNIAVTANNAPVKKKTTPSQNTISGNIIRKDFRSYANARKSINWNPKKPKSFFVIFTTT